MKPGRITSVISASANNEMAYKESHEGFSEYIHRSAMDRTELLLVNDGINGTNVDVIIEETWGVPLFAEDFIQKGPADYEADVFGSVRHSLRKLKDETNYWDEIVASTISTLLHLDTSEDKYDKKFLLPERLVRQVLTAYRSYVWPDLMAYVEKEESTLVDMCRLTSTTNKVRGCHFETIVIRRCSASNVDFQVGANSVTVPSGDRTATGFGGQLLPKFPKDGLSFSFDPNFPAIDFILKSGRHVFAIQVHVSYHDDVASALFVLCKDAGWFQQFDSIQLIYLSPEDEVTSQVAARVDPVFYSAVSTRQDGDSSTYQFTRRAISRASIACLRDLNWPDGCSLGSS